MGGDALSGFIHAQGVFDFVDPKDGRGDGLDGFQGVVEGRLRRAVHAGKDQMNTPLNHSARGLREES